MDVNIADRDQLSSAIGPAFRLERLLGVGAQAEVWLAQEVALDRPVAIKLLRGDLANHPRVLERLRREAVTVARVNSPYVVPVLQFVLRSDTPFIVMPFVAGETLVAALERRGTLPPAEVATIIRDVGAGLAAVHKLGVVHRDVKPSNILLDSETNLARLTDFGIAKALLSDRPALTTAGLLVGSAAYMSPEQFDDAAEVGPPCDIYSLGIVAFELLTGNRPFLGRSVAQLAFQHTSETADSLVGRDGIPNDLAELFDRCLSKEAPQRPSAEQLVELLDSQLTDASKPITNEKPRSVNVLKLAGLLIAVLALSVFALVFRGEALVMLKSLLKTLLKLALYLL